MKKYSHYFKHCPYEYVDVYRVLELFDVSNPELAHAIKKLLVAGGRGHKNITKDVQEAIDSLERWKEMRQEEIESSTNVVDLKGCDWSFNANEFATMNDSYAISSGTTTVPYKVFKL